MFAQYGGEAWLSRLVAALIALSFGVIGMIYRIRLPDVPGHIIGILTTGPDRDGKRGLTRSLTTALRRFAPGFAG